MIKLRDLLNEIDWEKDYPDVKKTCLSMKEVKNQLNQQLAWYKLTDKQKKKNPDMDVRKKNVGIPVISQGNIPLEDGGDINIKKYIEQITAKPKEIFDQNPKMERSDKGGYQYTMNTGIPALSGVAYSKKKGKFYNINTCPGAGSCARDCFARLGQYIMNDGKNLKYTQRLNWLLNDPKEYEEMILDELEPQATKVRRMSRQSGEDIKLILRWNDAGDFFSQKYFDIALSVTKRLKAQGFKVESYAYTKMGDLANMDDPDMLTTFSTDANKRERGKVDLINTKTSPIVPKEVFAKFFTPKGSHWVTGPDRKPEFRTDKGREELRAAIWSKYHKQYGITYDSLVYTDELPDAEGEKFQYNVIVMPQGDSDVGAQRKDVKVTFNLQH